ncbi:MAG TPA: AcvB/VirJ family lysyl-phosphatidylglycerol hydrolase [Gammaproteobacteria bacterium]|nr:AcvB/VirJ family lysyl-phosphatidylglycerol hydrolase [Gammaproteobacteria bacterium]
MIPKKLIALSLLAVSCSAFGGLKSMPGVYDIMKEPLKTGPRTVHLIYARPAQPKHPDDLVVFATGDGGWRSVSSEVFTHLAAEGYWVAGIDTPDALKPVKRAGERMSTAQAAERVKAAFADAKHDLGMPDTTPVIVVGFSRGATLVAFAALHPDVRAQLGGAIALALTREVDYLKAPPAERAEIQVDDRGRVQIYPALKLLGSTPLAVIQSTNDSYVPSAESRQLLGPDTPTLRLYEVESKNHRFGGGHDKMMADVDDALGWILQSRQARAAN